MYVFTYRMNPKHLCTLLQDRKFHAEDALRGVPDVLPHVSGGSLPTLVVVKLSCEANARVKPAKTGHGPHSS